MKLTKRLLSMLVVLTMVLSMIPAMASAKTVQVTDAFSYEENAAGWVEIGSTAEFNDWFRDTTNDSILRAASKAGKTVTAKLVLKADIELNVSGYVGTEKYPGEHNITLDLNSHTITSKSNGARQAFVVYDGNLTLLNGNITMPGLNSSTGGIFYVKGGSLTMRNVNVTRTQQTAKTTYGGGILGTNGATVNLENCILDATGSASVENGGVAYLTASSVVNMYNTKLLGGSAINDAENTDVGGCVDLSGSTLNMYSGEISGGYAQYRGGNVYLGSSSVFNLYGGVVANGETVVGKTAGPRGGNIYVASGTFNMYGGEVREGKSYIGNGICTAGVVNIYGGKIVHSTATSDSGTTGFLHRATGGTVAAHNLTIEAPKVTKAITGYYAAECKTISERDENGVVTVTSNEATAGEPVAATCTTPGYTPYTCSCGVTFVKDIVQPTHTEQVVSGYDPTCAASGMTDGKECADCGIILAGQYGIKKTGNHTNEETYVSPEGFGVGSYVTTCTTCGTVTSTVEDTLKLPGTATYVGIADGEASEDTLGRGTYIMIYPTGLNLEKANGFVGVKLYADDVLLATTTRPAGKPLTTTFAPINIEITRDTKNWDTVKEPGFPNPEIVPNRVEIFYGDMETVRGNFAITFEQPWAEYPSIANGGQHTPAEAVKENEVPGNCTADGSYESVVYCEICDCQLSRETKPVPAAGHKYDEVKTDATFESDAFTTYTCSVCGDSYTETHEGTKLTAVATADGVPFETLEEALAAGGEIVLLADGEAAQVRTNINLNGFTLKADVYGKLTLNGGTLITPQGYKMIGPDATYYISTDAVLTMDGPTGDITIHSGKLTLAQSWWTGAGQTLTIEAAASFEIPEGMSLNVLSTVIAAGQLTIAGTANLYTKDAVIHAPEGLNVTTTAGDKVIYAEGAYKAHSHVAGEKVTENETANSCTDDGSYDEVIYCSTCGDELSRETKPVPAAGHKYEGVKTDATTEADAFTTYTCSVCGHSYVETHEGTMIVTGATVNGTHYATLAEALENAEEGATVKLLEAAAADSLLIRNGITLDLNGQVLTANTLVTIKTAQVIDSTNGKGLLLIAREAIAISETKNQLPLWDDAENGYRFVEVSLRQSAKINEAGNGYLRFYIEGEDANCVLQQALSDGGADNGVYIQVELSWKDVNGSEAERTFIYSEELVAQYAENWTGNEFRLTVTGMKNVTELNLTATVVYKVDPADEKADTFTVAGETKTLKK